MKRHGRGLSSRVHRAGTIHTHPVLTFTPLAPTITHVVPSLIPTVLTFTPLAPTITHVVPSLIPTVLTFTPLAPTITHVVPSLIPTVLTFTPLAPTITHVVPSLTPLIDNLEFISAVVILVEAVKLHENVTHHYF
jgi:hypothetical protein